MQSLSHAGYATHDDVVESICWSYPGYLKTKVSFRWSTAAIPTYDFVGVDVVGVVVVDKQIPDIIYNS
jgi:hypothetical protein